MRVYRLSECCIQLQQQVMLLLQGTGPERAWRLVMEHGSLDAPVPGQLGLHGLCDA